MHKFCKHIFANNPSKETCTFLVFLNYILGYLKFCKTFIFEMAWSRAFQKCIFYHWTVFWKRFDHFHCINGPFFYTLKKIKFKATCESEAIPNYFLFLFGFLFKYLQTLECLFFKQFVFNYCESLRFFLNIRKSLAKLAIPKKRTLPIDNIFEFNITFFSNIFYL